MCSEQCVPSTALPPSRLPVAAPRRLSPSSAQPGSALPVMVCFIPGFLCDSIFWLLGQDVFALGPFCVPPAPIYLFSCRLAVPRCGFGLVVFFFLAMDRNRIEIMYHFLKKLNLALFAGCSAAPARSYLFLALMMLLPCLTFFEPFELLLEHNYLNYLINFSTIIKSHLRQNDCCGQGLFLCSP